MAALFNRNSRSQSVQLPPELEPMSLNLRLMQFMGIWGTDRKIHRFLLPVGWATLIILFPKAALGMGSSDYDAIAKGWAEFLLEATMFVAMCIFAAQGPHFERMVRILRGIIREVTEESKECYDLLQEQTAKINKYVKFYGIYCCFGPPVFCVPPMIYSYRTYFGSPIGNSTISMQFNLPMEQAFYGLQVRTNFMHYNLFVFISIFAYFVCAYFLMVKISTLLVIIKYSSLMFNVVALRVKKLDQLEIQEGDLQQSTKKAELIKIVDLHRRAYEITELVEELCFIPMALDFLTCMVFWVLTMFYLSTNFNLNVFNIMVLFLLTLFETFGYSYLGSELTSSAYAVGNAIYDLRWFDDSVPLQKYYRIMIQRSQRATGVTVAKFFLVGLGTFGSVVQMSYSYYIVLKDVLVN